MGAVDAAFFVCGTRIGLMHARTGVVRVFVPDPIAASDAQPAASSAAIDLSPERPDPLASLSAPDLLEWRKSGALPKTDPPVATTPADSSPATAVQDPPASTDATSQATSELADTDPDYKPKTAKRIQELLARAERAEKALASVPPAPRAAQPSVDARPAASSAAPAGPLAPSADDFPFGTADPGYLAALSTFTVQTTLAAERAKWEAGQREAQSRAEHARVMAAFHEKTAAARLVHADFDEIAMKATTLIQPGSLADLFVLENKADEIGVGGAEVLYHLQQPANRAEQARILALPTMDQFIALVRLGDRLKVGAAAPTTTAPPPPPALRTRATPGDPVERALKAGDAGAYIRAANEREIAARRR